MRQDIVNAVNKLSMNAKNIDIDVLKMYHLIFAYMKEHKKPVKKMELLIDNGVLVIDGKYIERIAALPKKTTFDEESYYIEGKILARAGL